MSDWTPAPFGTVRHSGDLASGLVGPPGADGNDGADGADGAAGSTGPAGPTSGNLPDDEFTSHDLTSAIRGLFSGSVSLGTGGSAEYRWQRVGRGVEGKVTISAAADHTITAGDGPLYVLASDLPVAPAEYQQTSGFGFCNVPLVWGESICAGIANVGAWALVFFLGTTPGDGAAGNLWSDGNPDTLTGNAFTVVADFGYEADDAAAPPAALPWDLPWGTIKRLTASSNTTGITSGSTIFSFTMPTWPDGRIIKVTYTGSMSSTANGAASAYLNTAGSPIARWGAVGTSSVLSASFTAFKARRSDDVSGQTIAGTVARDSGAGTVTYQAGSGRTGYFLIEDAGPNPDA